MSNAIYRIVEHDGGWAYKSGDVFSETFRTRDQAVAAARRVALEQRLPDVSRSIEFEDEHGVWRRETADGADRPNTSVED